MGLFLLENEGERNNYVFHHRFAPWPYFITSWQSYIDPEVFMLTLIKKTCFQKLFIAHCKCEAKGYYAYIWNQTCLVIMILQVLQETYDVVYTPYQLQMGYR